MSAISEHFARNHPPSSEFLDLSRDQPQDYNADQEDLTTAEMINRDLRQYLQDSRNKVINEPVRALIYSFTIKAICLTVAMIFPLLAYATFGVSVALIDRYIVFNFGQFFLNTIHIVSNFVWRIFYVIKATLWDDLWA
jgi:hypothetical protein